MSTWLCTNCDHQYRSEQGDLRRGIAPGTGFHDLPPDWACPKCGASKIEFTQISGSSSDGSGWATANS